MNIENINLTNGVFSIGLNISSTNYIDVKINDLTLEFSFKSIYEFVEKNKQNINFINNNSQMIVDGKFDISKLCHIIEEKEFKNNYNIIYYFNVETRKISITIVETLFSKTITLSWVDFKIFTEALSNIYNNWFSIFTQFKLKNLNESTYNYINEDATTNVNPFDNSNITNIKDDETQTATNKEKKTIYTSSLEEKLSGFKNRDISSLLSEDNEETNKDSLNVGDIF